MATRPCRFCLSLQGGSVFADFDVDPDGRVFAVRVSFDGYGCCTTTSSIGRMDVEASKALLAMIDRGAIDDVAANRALREYFRANSDVLWKDALEEHALL